MSGSDSNTEIQEEYKSSANDAGMKIIEINWLDSWGVHGWGDRDQRVQNANAEFGANVSVGYLLYESDEWVILTEAISHKRNVGCTTAIPRFSIISITVIRDGPNV